MFIKLTSAFPIFFLGFSVFSTISFGQDIPVQTNPETKTEKSPTPVPTPKQTPKPTPQPISSYMEQPDYKAYMVGVMEKDPAKKITAFEKYLNDYPNSPFITLANQALLDAMVKANPADKDRIYQQALNTIAPLNINTFSGTLLISNTFNSVVTSLFKAEMNDKAFEFSQKGIALIDEITARDSFKSKFPMWITMGKIAMLKGDLKSAENYFKQSLGGDFEGNTALLGLADIAEKRKKRKQQLEYLIQAEAKGNLSRENRAKLETIYVNEKGSTKGLREILDENYKRSNPFPFVAAEYIQTEKRSKKIVLAELFTGSACQPCISADIAFEGLLQRYDSKDVAVLIYDLHIPGPDPITNPASIARAKFYGANSTPTFIIDGTDKNSGGGSNRKLAKNVFDRITPKIDSMLEKQSEADLTLDASIKNGIIKTNLNVENIKGDYKTLKVHIGLVENELSYMGENGIRFHPMSLRELGGENRDGFILKDKNGSFEWQFDLQKVSIDLKSYIDKFELNQQKEDKEFTMPEKKHEINSKNLSVVAFIQDEKTKAILQSTFINLAESKK